MYQSYFNPRLLVIPLLIVIGIGSCAQKKEVVCSSVELVAPKVILVMGQSNTHAGLGLDPILDAIQPGIYQLGRFDNNNCIIEATEPLDHHTKTEGRIGFALTFAKLMQAHIQSSNDILIVPCGFGATGFIDNRWNKTNDLYNDAVARIRLVMETYPNAELVAILWHQGETDVMLQNQNYQSDLDEFITNIRHDMNSDSVPFILGGMVPYWVNQDAERQQQQQLIAATPTRVGKTGYADPSMPFVIEKSDNTFDEIHFDAAGQRELGARYFEQYLFLTD